MNSLNIISPYKFNGQWVFDDPSKNLVREPFVAGADNIIDVMVRDMPDAWKGFILIFCAEQFPGSHMRLQWVKSEHGGNWYDTAAGQMGWLCPALMKYFENVPLEIYLQFKESK